MTGAARDETPSQEETEAFRPRWDANGLVPVVAQGADGTVLMLAYANEEALRATMATGEAHYWSRSRGELWRKGATSGAVQTVRAVLCDCDQDAFIYQVEQSGPACHTGRRDCFYREVRVDRSDSIQSLNLAFND